MTDLNFDALENLRASLLEAKKLRLLARLFERSSKRERAIALNKASILLMATKLEAFLEEIFEECIFKINHSKRHFVPINIKLSASQEILDKALLKKSPHEKSVEFVKLSRIWLDPHSAIFSIENKFSYGKHGEKEIIRLFKKIGIEDIFQLPSIKKHTTDLKGDINSLVALRNNIIHQDASPSLTGIDVYRYEKSVCIFCELLGVELAKYLKEDCALSSH